MITLGIILSLTILLTGIIGYIFISKKDLIIILICLELICLSISILFINVSFIIDDITGILISLLILPLAGAESALALTLLVCYYPMRGTLVMN